jgi:hypothetical protein
MTAPASRHASSVAELERLAESGALDELAWALTGVLLSAAQRLAPEAPTPAAAAWTVARRADPSLGSPDSTKGEPRLSMPTKKAAPLPGHGPSEAPRVRQQGEPS